MAENVIKIILATLFFVCLADLPYGYYQLVRFCALVGFTILAFKAKEKDHTIEAITYVALAILFQPLFKISLGRELWNVVDVIVGVALIFSILNRKEIKKFKQ